MVQEVQQQGNRYQDPKLIPGVGISERKVKYHTQVAPSFGYECSANGDIEIIAYPYSTTDGYGSFSIQSLSGDTQFRMRNGGLRVPLAGAYLVEITTSGANSVVWNHKLVVGDKTLFSYQGTTSSPITKVINLGRGNLLQYKCTITNNTSGGGTVTGHLSITLKKL